ncbi:hypothetical protein ABZS79_13700 [Streptomyces griseoloalbus]|uniref:hypothetical protein n=1 Tax=Streptomyces griseoloalbus TaxID=67303 RepID=UPI0033AA9055
MSTSAEHTYISEVALNVLEESANSQLFGCNESDRKRFDFACTLTRDWSRVVSGQTLWKHDGDGIDKDFRTLLTDDDATAAVYIARDSMKNRNRIDEIIRDYRSSPLRSSLSKLRIFWVTGDFDADKEHERVQLRARLRHDIYQDLLLRVALGGITPQDIRNFASSGRLGSPVWILNQISKDGYLGNYTHASKKYGIGIPPLKEELLRLEFTGLISRDEPKYQGLLQVTDKGRAMLDICAQLHDDLSGRNKASEEFLYICKILDMNFEQAGDFSALEERKTGLTFGYLANNAELMLACLYYASQHGELEWSPELFQRSADRGSVARRSPRSARPGGST